MMLFPAFFISGQIGDTQKDSEQRLRCLEGVKNAATEAAIFSLPF